MNKLSRTTILTPPNNAKKVLMHSCCAPCSGGIMESFIASKIEFTVLFYNPNIQPREEYEMRKNENMRFTKKMNIPFIDLDYEDRSLWFKRAKGLELVPERGQRCTMCFDMRFERSALFAKENGFPVFTSSLGISKWKDLDQVNASGMRSASRYPDLIYWTFNWRKKGGAPRMYELSKEEEFYKQEYCGCVYSLRDTNLWRQKQGRPKIDKGKEFYGK